MGSCFSSEDKVAPREMHFVNDGQERVTPVQSGDERMERKRRLTTDITCSFFMTAYYLFLSGMIGYCVYYGDVDRIINGYDNCGNVCGKDNVHEKYECTGVDMSDKPFLLVRGSSGISVIPTKIDRECVMNCSIYPDYHRLWNRCIPYSFTNNNVVNTIFSKTGLSNFFQEVSEDFSLCWWEVLYLCLIALGFSVMLMVLLHFVVDLVVFFVLSVVSVATVGSAIYLWIIWKQLNDTMDLQPENHIPTVDSRNNYTYLVFAIIATIISIIVLLVILVMRKRIQLVIELFKESGKAISAMPMLLFEPIITFIAIAVVISVWFYFAIWIESAGFIQGPEKQRVHYQKNYLMYITRWHHLFGMFWMLQFVIGCQHIIIAGAVSKWYFTRNKKNLQAPILESLYYLIRYHLGSVALGSFVVALVQLIRVVLAMIQKYLLNKEGRCAGAAMRCCQCCLCCFEKVLQYVNRNAYIEIAINGSSFCKAGKEAFRLLVSNALRVTAINSVGDFVLFLGKVFVVVITVFIGLDVLQKKHAIQHIWVPATLVGLFAYFISHCFLTVYEMTIDTIFLCFCEDCEQNDGISKAYFMSRDLMKFVDDSKKALKIPDQTVRGQDRQATVSTIS